ncbi:MAG: hypothetical protein ACI4S4_06980 [Candidatus Ornithospirochaeta sp.]
METIKRSELIAARLRKASAAVNTLTNELDELKQRLSLVEIHNEELQALIDKIGESAAQLASTIETSIKGLDQDMDFVFNEDESSEIASAEEFSASGSVDVDFDF